MKHKLLFVATLVIVLTVVMAASDVMAQGPTPRNPRVALGTGFTYQGQLKNGGNVVNGTCDLQLGLWDDASVGTLQGVTQTVTVNVTNGLFTTVLNSGGEFGTSAFDGNARWLAMTVRCPSGSGSYTPLGPRQSLTPAPMALALPGLYTQQNATSPNLIGGYSGNIISPTVVGGTIGGGGQSGSPNRVWDNFATVSGGKGNTARYLEATVSGGGNNTASNFRATVGGGGGNTASGYYATIGGGMGNTASNTATTIGGGYSNSADDYAATVSGGQANHATKIYSTVGGGQMNSASNYATTVGGGESNYASGNYATIPGGHSNSAAMPYTLAAGRRAKANHDGAFVWGDSTDADFTSTANNQFLVRAGGGVGINTNAPTANTLTVGGSGLKVGTTGTTLAVVQSGTATLGSGLAGANVYTVTFPSTFSSMPRVLVTIRSDSAYTDTFAVTTQSISTTQFRVNVYRVDNGGLGWAQSLLMDWIAWQ